MDPETLQQQITVICEFVDFARDFDKSKGVKNMYALVVKPKSLSEHMKVKVVESARKCFTTIDFNNITDKDVLEFKTGSVNLGRLYQKLEGDDLETFNEYMDCFRSAYEKDNAAVETLLSELDIEKDSPEASFLKRVFNEIGQEFMDMVKSHQGSGDFDIHSLLPRVAMLFKSGKLTNLMSDFGDSGVKMSKILFAVGKLLEKYEDQQDKEKEDDKDGNAVEETE